TVPPPGKTRFLVEMHGNPSLSMAQNSADLLAWCAAQSYRAYHLPTRRPLQNPAEARAWLHPHNDHLLVQPAAWPIPGWLGEPISA
ncbi:MAG: hypothetical protein HC915_20260, partial [Anaerolineae bacterium]|nr:hypothetical protein [Anaerolineae bacterium]